MLRNKINISTILNYKLIVQRIDNLKVPW